MVKGVLDPPLPSEQERRMIRLKCPKCETSLRIDDSKAGSIVACPKCAQKLRAPQRKPPAAGEAKETAVPSPPPKTRPAGAGKTPSRPREETPPAKKVAKVPPRQAEEDAEDRSTPLRPPVPQRLPCFDTEPYRPQSGLNAVGALIMIGIIMPGAILFGFLASFIGQWFYVVLLFPGGVALGVFICGAVGVRVGKVHSPLFSGAVGLVAATLAMLAMHFFDYQRDLGKAKEANPGVEVQGPGLFKYLDEKAKVGITLTGRGGGKTNLGYVGTYINFIVEYLFVAAICAGFLYSFARSPFCGRILQGQGRPAGQ
jgi:predicted Zn finger-like uncharacterized protein